MTRLYAAAGLACLLAGCGGAHSALDVRTTWTGTVAGQRATLDVGETNGRGFVLLQQKKLPPQFFVLPWASGAPRIVAASKYGDWLLETRSGALAEVKEDEGGNGSYQFLGRALDPKHLPPLARSGIAAAVLFGAHARRAVLLAGATSYGEYRLYGRLDGFTLAGGRDRLNRLLRDRNGATYRVDVATRRLVRVGTAPAPETDALAKPPPPCRTFGQYRACPTTIVHNGRVLLHAPPNVPRRWGFLEPSPDGKTLLLEEEIYGCGVAQEAYFARAGTLTPALPGAEKSIALGWLRDGEALVIGAGIGCEGEPPSGVYRAYPDGGAPVLLLPAAVDDATTWR